MFEITLIELEQELKDSKKMYEGDLETFKKDNEYLIKSSEAYFKAQIELLNFKLGNWQNSPEDHAREEARDAEANN